jgi:hypothetical protein
MAAEFRKGTKLIKEAAESKGGKRRFTPNIYWKADDSRYVVFLTGAEEIPQVKLHAAVRVPNDSERGYSMENYLCRKDPALVEESGGQCELCDRIGHTPTVRHVALAVEVEPAEKNGKEVTAFKIKYNIVKRDDGTEVEYPQWGLVAQAAGNFFSWLAAFDENKGDIRKRVFEIQREGGGTQTKYHFFMEVAPVPDLSSLDEVIPELTDLLEEMASDEKYAKLSTVEAGSQPTFGESDNKATSTSPDRKTKFDEMKDKLAATGVSAY